MQYTSSQESLETTSTLSEHSDDSKDSFQGSMRMSALQWLMRVRKMVQDLPDHPIYRDHQCKVQSNVLPENKGNNYEWGRATEYEKQLEVFDTFRTVTLDKLAGDLNREQVTKVYHSVMLELNRLNEALPIYAKKIEILEAIRNNRVTTLVGNTGIGKSTQIMPYLLEIEEFTGKIALGQPHWHSLESIVLRVEQESKMKIALVPEHSSRMPPNDERLEIHTHRSLISLLIDDFNLSQYSCIIIDEAHERFIESDIVLSLMKDALSRNPNLRLIVTSATADQTIFDNLFNVDVPRIQISGISHNLEVEYISSFANNKDRTDEIIYCLLEKAIKNEEEGISSHFDGSILIFVPSIKEISKLQRMISPLCRDHYEIKEFHGYLDSQARKEIFEHSNKPKIIISTRLGETAITIPDLRVVIDTGIDILRTLDRMTHMTIEQRGQITQSSAKQRAGRTGRTCSGICYRLYSKEDYEALDKYEKSALKRYYFHRTIVILKALKISNIVGFNFLEELDEEDKRDMKSDEEFLYHIDALDAKRELTKLGTIMSECSLEPYLIRSLFESVKLDCAEEVKKILGLFSNDWKLFVKGEDIKQQKRNFCEKDGDFLMLLNIYQEYEKRKDGYDLIGWMEENHLSPKAFTLTDFVIGDLGGVVEKMRGLVSEVDHKVDRDSINDRILKCFFMGFWVNLTRVLQNSIQLCRLGRPIRIHPQSSMGLVGRGEDTEFMICANIAKSEHGLSGMYFSRISPEWIKELPAECRQQILPPYSLESVFRSECQPVFQTERAEIPAQEYAKNYTYSWDRVEKAPVFSRSKFMSDGRNEMDAPRKGFVNSKRNNII